VKASKENPLDNETCAEALDQLKLALDPLRDFIQKPNDKPES